MSLIITPDIENIIDNLPGVIFLVGTDNKFVFSNKAGAKLVGFSSPDDVISCSYADVPAQVSESAQTLEKINKLVIERDTIVNSVSYHGYANDEWIVFFGSKTPCYDREGNLMGVMCSLHNITNCNLLNLGALLFESSRKQSPKKTHNQFDYILEQKDYKHNLSTRQLECLFLLLLGKSSKMIASILQLSYRTVEQYIEHIKFKMNCQNKAELIETAIMQGYINVLPKSLLNSDLINKLK